MILQRAVPYDVLTAPSLPGIAPLAPEDWLLVDDAYAAQMSERARLIKDRPDEVLALQPAARAAADELLHTVLQHLPKGFTWDGATVVRPDGVCIAPDMSDPLRTLGHLVQEDFCLMQRHDGRPEHVLTGAILCFPASWRLSEKLGRPLVGIHAPVPEYDPSLARRVQRLFDGVQVGRPLWRKNALFYPDPTLFQPRSEAAPRRISDPGKTEYLRTERQCLWRLPDTRAVVFSIHTFVVHRSDLPA